MNHDRWKRREKGKALVGWRKGIASRYFARSRCYEVEKKESLIENGRRRRRDRGGGKARRETAQKSCRLKGRGEKEIEERCCNDAAVGTSPFPFSLFLSLFLSQPTFKVTTCAEKYQSLDNEILISWWWYRPPSKNLPFFFLFFLLLFLTNLCITVYFRDSSRIDANFTFRSGIDQFLRERIEGKGIGMPRA